MKINLFRHYVPLALLSGGLLLSCSHDELIERGASGSGVISFSTAGNRFSTRVAPMVSEDMRTFRVWGYGSEPTGILANLNGAEVSRASAADDWVYNPMGEWPANGTVVFYAVSPASAVAQNAVTLSDDAATFTYTVPVAADQVDLLIVKTDGFDAAAHSSPVQLTFTHALSRIGLKVKTDAGGIGAKFKIGDVKLLNVNSTGTYSFIDGTWSDLTGLTSYNVSVDESWSDGKVLTTADSIVIGGDNGLMILPQTAVPGTYQIDGTAPASGTYLSLKATLVKEGEDDVEHTFYFPVVDNTEDRNPLEFEKGKQYTFNLELQAGSGFNAFQITFSGVASEPWGNGTGALDTQVRVWSRSNIYFQPDEGETDIGFLTFSETDSSLSGYQGLYFKWGSLIGIAVTGDFDDDTYFYIPDRDTGKYYRVMRSEISDDYDNGVSAISSAVQDYAKAVTGQGKSWNDIPYVTNDSGDDQIDTSGQGRDDHRLTVKSDEALYAKYKGDICKFLSDKKDTNGSDLTRNWVMPVSNDFGSDGNYTKSDTWDNTTTASSAPENGTSVIPNTYYTYTTTTGEKVTFPASGFRYNGSGTSVDVGYGGRYWSSSVSGASHAYGLYFGSGGVYPADGFDFRAYGRSVRCVRN